MTTAREVMARQCECEHAAHFDRRGHNYGDVRNCQPVSTTYGTFALCDGCRRAGHMQPTSLLEGQSHA
jgi:hypothetical protein